jgi:hypothetical protein
MNSRSARKLIAAFAIGLAMASCLALSAQAAPLFDLHLMPPGPVQTDIVDSPAPIIQGIDGTDGVFGSGSAFGRAQLGNLGAKVTVVSTAPTINNGAGSIAEVAFHDSFPIFIAGPTTTFDSLKITVSLDGSTSVSGSGSSTVRLVASGDNDVGDFNGVTLDGPGMATIVISLAKGGDHVKLDADLQVRANVLGPASAIADFSQSSRISAVQLFDDQGNFIQNVTLVDDAGNVLPVPEPSAGQMAALACGMIWWWKSIGHRTARRGVLRNDAGI